MNTITHAAHIQALLEGVASRPVDIPNIFDEALHVDRDFDLDEIETSDEAAEFLARAEATMAEMRREHRVLCDDLDDRGDDLRHLRRGTREDADTLRYLALQLHSGMHRLRRSIKSARRLAGIEEVVETPRPPAEESSKAHMDPRDIDHELITMASHGREGYLAGLKPYLEAAGAAGAGGLTLTIDDSNFIVVRRGNIEIDVLPPYEPFYLWERSDEDLPSIAEAARQAQVSLVSTPWRYSDKAAALKVEVDQAAKRHREADDLAIADPSGTNALVLAAAAARYVAATTARDTAEADAKAAYVAQTGTDEDFS